MQAVACAGFGVIAALAVAPAGLFAQSFCSYEITALIDDQSCEFSPTNPAVLDINDHDQACGRLTNCADTLDRPWVWSPEIGLMVLPLPPGADRGEAVGISNELGADGIGAVACTLEGFGIGGQRAFVFDEGVWTELPPANGGFHSGAADMSGTGIVGGARSVGSIAHAFRWQDGAFEDVAPPPGTEAAPRAVADDGSIAGYLLASFNRAFRWRQAGIEDLGSVIPGGQNSIAESISIQGDVGGNTSIQLIPGNPFSFITQAWVWREKEVITFETIDGAVASELAAMNDVGQVIVATYDSDPGTDDVVVYIWQDGYAVPFLDLCDVPDHFVIAAPVSTNGVGDIGCSFYIGQGRFVSVILSPIGRPLGDVNIDCRVDERDLIEVLEDWGPDKHGHPGDMVSGDTFQPPGDGSIDAADLAIVLGNWTAKAARGTTR